MIVSKSRRLARMLVPFAALSLAAGAVVAIPASSQAATQGPCDIYANGGTPCVAAHSTTRALFGSYNGNLYQVRRSSNNATLNIGVLSAGGYANAAAQDSFCSGTSCVVTEIYDQSGHGNNLTQAPGGGAAGGPDNLANATAAPTTLNGHEAYGVYVASGTGYRDDNTSGIATGDASEGEYAVFDGTHYNGGCCFDYGNAETSNNDTGAGHMEAIYFGNIKVWGYGSGNGPWIMADMENGLFSGQNAGFNSGDPTINDRYTTAMLEGGQNQWALLGGNAQSGGLSTLYSGARPSGYNPMHKEGAIILGIGGDNSKGSAGTFYEGVMTSGYPSSTTESSVQSNIVAAGYGSGGGSGGVTGTHEVVNRNASNLCLDDYNFGTSNGAPVDLWTCWGGSVQQWTFTSVGSGYDELINGNSGTCLDSNGTHTPGTQAVLWSCNGGNNQQWSVVSAGSGYCELVNRASGFCLDDYNYSTSPGTIADLYTCSGGTVQQWSMP